MKKIVETVRSRIERMDKKQEFISVCILSGFLVFGILLVTGVMTSGWHLNDDHEFLRMIYRAKIEGKSFCQIVTEFTRRDMFNRFRPLYMPARVLSCYLFGENLLLYYIMKAVETYVSCILLYYVGRQLIDSKMASFLFAAVSLVGYQSVSWWKLGTHEMQGVLLLAISWLSLMWWIKKDKRIWEVVSIISAVLMMLYKESFLIMAPFIMVFAVYYEIWLSKAEFSVASAWEAVKKRKSYLLFVFVFFLLFAFYFVFGVGIGGYDMSGGSQEGFLSEYWNGITGSLENNLKWYFRFGVLFVAILLTYWENLKKLWVEMLVVCVFLLPQLVVYGRVGFSGHYLLPLTIVFSLFFVLWTWDQKFLSGKRRVVYLLGILLLLAANGRVALREGDYFRLRGEGITTAFETIRELSEENEEVKVLSCFDRNTEANMTLQYYLLDHGIDNLYYWIEEENTIDVNYKGASMTSKREACEFDDIDVIIAHNKEDRHWYYDPEFDFSDFTEFPCGTMTLYIRNSAGFDMPQIQVEGLKINF